jgi:transglutaminase-like putative cysteine protease
MQRYSIHHETVYRYTHPVSYSIQMLRLTPRNEPHQRVLQWHISAPGQLRRVVDAYGNISHLLTLSEPHSTIRLVVNGLVEVAPLAEGRLIETAELPPQAFAVPTPLTQPTGLIRAFCAGALPQGLNGPGDALRLAAAICEAVAYKPGVTEVSTAAEAALQLGQGVCQDHAHLFLACARSLQVPARYVSGYLHTTASHAASHAWVDVWFPQVGWVSIDVTHRQYADASHCRLAVARDYDSASPIRGMRHGGGRESMAVVVRVQQGDQ